MKSLANVSLEISAKPLFRKDDTFVHDLFVNVFRHWWSLLKHADSVSLLWWLSDGTDILEYDGHLDRKIEWGKWQGFAHPTVKSSEHDPHGESIITRPRLYRAEPVELTYGDLRRIIGLMKQAAREVLGTDLQVGIPFDPGCEFCQSPFRYQEHPELLIGDHMVCIDATGRLHADPRAFAGFPQGVPEGTTFAAFLGRQANCYLRDLGFDYLWFSNSFGFGRSPYAFGGAGQFFNGERYTPAGNAAVRDAVFEFWRGFRAECPAARVECRGTDFTVGMNLVNHATPYAQLYAADFNITPPPNTPWSALTSNHGLALAGYLSQISAYRGDRFPFRYYVADPWFCNNPWVDRWERNPHDVYLSTAVTRLDEQGRVQAFNDVKVLTIDGSWGELPEQFPDEVIPHLKRAVDYRPDGMPPLVWVYPFAEYHRYTFAQPERIAEPMCGDIFVQQALNLGLPLSGVVTTDAFAACWQQHPERFAGVVLLTPVPEAGGAAEAALLAHLAGGGQVLCYGPTDHASSAWLDLLGVKHATPLAGELAIAVPAHPDRCALGTVAAVCRHEPALSAGGICEVLAKPAATVLATVSAGGEQRVAALRRGNLAWVRGTSSLSVEAIRGRNLEARPPTEVYPCEALLRYALGGFGWEIGVDRREPSPQSTHLMISRCRNAFVMAGYSPDDSAVFRLRTPWGAPLLPGRNAVLEGGCTLLPVNRWFHEEVRVFVEQEDGPVELHTYLPHHYRYRRRWRLNRLRHATVRFFIESGCEAHLEVLRNPHLWLLTVGESGPEPRLCDSPAGKYLEILDANGTLTIAWGRDDEPDSVLPPA